MKNNNKILTITVILLLITNLALVAFMVFGGNKKGKGGSAKKGDPFETIEKELGMSPEQKKAHLQYRDEYFKVVRPLFDSVRMAKAAYFGLAKDSAAADSVINAAYLKLTDFQATIDKRTFEHFRRVRALYSGEQQRKYDELVQKMMTQKGRRDSSGRNGSK